MGVQSEACEQPRRAAPRHAIRRKHTKMNDHRIFLKTRLACPSSVHGQLAARRGEARWSQSVSTKPQNNLSPTPRAPQALRGEIRQSVCLLDGWRARTIRGPTHWVVRPLLRRWPASFLAIPYMRRSESKGTKPQSPSLLHRMRQLTKAVLISTVRGCHPLKW